MRRVTNIILKTLGWILASVLLLIIIIFIVIQIPAVQNFAKDKAVTYLKNKTKTEISVGTFRLKLFNSIELGDVFVRDQKQDTLLYAQKLQVNLHMLQLLKSNANVSRLELTNAYVNMNRTAPDTVFNFQFIIDAFASPEPVKKDSAVSDFVAKVKEIGLNNVKLNYADDVVGSSFNLVTGKLETELANFDLRTLTMIFGDIRLQDTHAKMHMYKPTVFLSSATILETGTKDTATSSIPLGIGDIDFKRISVDYLDELSPMHLNFSLNTLRARPKTVDLSSMNFHLTELALDSARTQIVMGPANKKKADVKTTNDTDTATINGWHFVLDKIAITNNFFSLDDKDAPRQPRGIDFGHLALQDFNFLASNVNVVPDNFQGTIDSLSLREKSGFTLRNLHTNFQYTDKFASLGNLLIQTPQTLIRDSIYLGYKSIDALGKDPGNAYIDANLRNTRIAVKDILLLAPDLESQLGSNRNAVLNLNTKITGYIKDIKIPTLELNGLGNTQLKISGNIKGLPDAANAYFDLKIDKLITTRADLLNFIPAGTIPPNTIRIPEKMSLHGFIRGNMKDLATQLNIATSSGNANIIAFLNENGRYTANVSTSSLNLGQLLYQEENVGSVTANIKAEGSGLDLQNFDIKKLYSNFSGNVASARVKDYTYHNFDINGILSNGEVNSVAKMQDDNLTFDLVSNINLNNEYPGVKAEMVLDTLNAQALGFSEGVLTAKTKLFADFTNTNPDHLNGNLVIRDFSFVTDSTAGRVDSLTLTATNQGDYNQLILTLDSALRVNMRGVYKLTQLPLALMSTINHYYSLPDYKTKPFAPQQFDLEGYLVPNGSILALMPSLQGSDSLAFNSTYNSINDTLIFNAKSNRIKLSDNDIRNLDLRINTENDSLKIAGSVDNVFLPSLKLFKTSLTGSLANNNLVFDVQSNDENDKPWYALGGTVATENNGYNLSLKPQDFILDYEKWTVAPDNLLRYSSTEGVYAHNFTISKTDQSLTLNSETTPPNAPLDVNFKNFKISTITNIANQTELPLEGTINGTAQVRDLLTQPLFVSDLNIDDIAYNNDTIGNLKIEVNNNKAANIYSAKIGLDGQGNDVRITGDFYAQDSRLDMLFDARRLNLETIKPFAGEQIIDIGGYATSQIKINGSTSAPVIDGYFNFDTAFVTPFITGEKLTFNNQRINAKNQSFSFDNFTLTDSRKNSLVIDGGVNTKNFSAFNFDLDINADDFQAINAEPAAKRTMYGTLNLDLGLTVLGNMTSPYVRGDVRINKNSDFKMTMPGGDPELEDREGVVVFVDQANQEAYIQQLLAQQDSLAGSVPLKGMDLFVNITTDSAATLSLVMDERSGDALSVRGLASLDFGIDRSGKMNLTGNYLLTHGNYNLSFAFLKRNFEIQPGSTIMWTGDPLTANVDITAIHSVKTSPADLIAQQSAEVETRYYQLLPFEVRLGLAGELMKPTITFDIVLTGEQSTEQWSLVDSKLAELRKNSSEMNKQVFALMLLGRFVGPNPLESAGPAMNVGNMAKQSLSNLLSQELNKFAGNMIKGVDVNFGLTSGTDYSSGEAVDRTDLSVGLSKRLLDDRLTVSVGSNFALGGTSANQSSTNIAGDVTLDYKLTNDGKYRIRAYRRNIYEGVIEGQIVRTGVAFALTMEYEKFKEIFSRPENQKYYRKKRREQNRERRQEEAEKQFNQDQQKAEQGI